MKNIHVTNSTVKGRIGLAVAVLAGAVFMVLRFREFPVGAGMDDAYYVELARSLAEGRGPVIHLNPVAPVWRPDIFPLGFPLLLSPLALLAPGSLQIFKLVPMLALAGLIPLCLGLARRCHVARGTVLAALVFLNPWAVAFSVRVFSDIPFAAVSLAALLLFLRLVDDDVPGPTRFAALILVTAAAVMIRSIGLALPVAMLVFWLLHRRWREAVILAGGLVLALIPHALLSGTAGAGLITRAYNHQVFARDDAVISRFSLMGANLVGYLRELPVVLLPVFGNPLENLAQRAGLGSVYGPIQLMAGLALTGAIILGLREIGKRSPTAARFLSIYLVIYGGVLLNFSGYPSGVQPRLLLPILPLFLLAVLEFLQRRDLPGGRRLFLPAVALMFGLALVHNGYRSAVPLRSGFDAEGVALIDPGSGADWMSANSDPTDVVMVRWPLRQHIHLLRPVVGYGSIGSAELAARISRYEVDFIWLGPDRAEGVTQALEILLKADPEGFSRGHHDQESGVMIFRVEPSP